MPLSVQSLFCSQYMCACVVLFTLFFICIWYPYSIPPQHECPKIITCGTFNTLIAYSKAEAVVSFSLLNFHWFNLIFQDTNFAYKSNTIAPI